MYLQQVSRQQTYQKPGRDACYPMQIAGTKKQSLTLKSYIPSLSSKKELEEGRSLFRYYLIPRLNTHAIARQIKPSCQLHQSTGGCLVGIWQRARQYRDGHRQESHACLQRGEGFCWLCRGEHVTMCQTPTKIRRTRLPDRILDMGEIQGKQCTLSCSTRLYEFDSQCIWQQACSSGNTQPKMSTILRL